MLQKFFRNLRKTVLGYKYYLSVCCIIKDENAYLEEWITYHLKIGVQHFFIYDNESAVKITDTLTKLNLLAHATVIPISGKSMQMKAYQHFLKNYKMLSRWTAFIDTDEFIVPKMPRGNLPLLLKDFEPYGGLGINWLIFGSSGLKTKQTQSQLSSFTLRSEIGFQTNRHIKSIVQNKYVKWIDNPHFVIYQNGYFCVNENQQRIDGPFSDTSVDKIQLNHYYCRSLEEYQQKILRGRSDDGEIQRKMKDFQEHDEPSNSVKDTSAYDIFNGR